MLVELTHWNSGIPESTFRLPNTTVTQSTG